MSELSESFTSAVDSAVVMQRRSHTNTSYIDQWLEACEDRELAEAVRANLLDAEGVPVTTLLKVIHSKTNLRTSDSAIRRWRSQNVSS